MKPHVLRSIENKNIPPWQYLNDMLVEWLIRHPDPTWTSIIEALQKNGYQPLAKKIALKYGNFIIVIIMCKLCHFLL